MTMIPRPARIAALVAALVLPLPSVSGAQTATAHDCSRWPASVFDEVSGSCVCPQGMWWNLRGDACLPREHAAHEFCTTVWPSSDPFFVAGGGYRCVCAPPLIWNAEATACRPTVPIGQEDCTAEWPGTLPVLSPSGTEFECRCPAGRRWDETNRACVDGAPVVSVSRGFFPDGSGADPGMAAPVPGGVPSPPRAAGVPDAGSPAATMPPGMEPPAQDSPREIPGRSPGEGPAYAPPAGPGAASPGAAGQGAAVNPKCEALLSEIRGRAAAGQSDQADALGMRAAVAGCDPAAISEASRVKQ
jgi:hypothetical protein